MTLVRLPDGNEVICGHPLERQTAERETGERWEDLLGAGRVVQRYALLCLQCGHVEHYGERISQDPADFFVAISYQPTAEDATGAACASCGAEELRPTHRVIRWYRLPTVPSRHARIEADRHLIESRLAPPFET